MTLKKIVLIVAIFILPALLIAQTPSTKSGKFGIGIDGFGSNMNYVVKVFVSDDVALEGIGQLSITDTGKEPGAGEKDVTGYRYGIGLNILYHWNTSSNGTPFVGIGGMWIGEKKGGIINVEEDEKDWLDFSAILGGEYFLSTNFSLGVKAEGVISLGLSRDVPANETGTDLNLFTRTNVTARFYFQGAVR